MEKNELLAKIKEEALLNHVPILQDVSLKLIEVILDIKRPNKILEIGTAVGYSAINFPFRSYCLTACALQLLAPLWDSI